MKVKILSEAGYEEALKGLSLNKNQPYENMPNAAQKLSGKGFGHDKFLESIYVWMEVTAPMYWWSHADTYRISTKQSQSNMHTMLKKECITQADFSDVVTTQVIMEINSLLQKAKETASATDKNMILEQIMCKLPMGYLQKRIWCLNYKTIGNIISQRKNHKLLSWAVFCEKVLEQIQHRELLEWTL